MELDDGGVGLVLEVPMDLHRVPSASPHSPVAFTPEEGIFIQRLDSGGSIRCL